MEAQNAAHACDCGKVKVTLLNKRNGAEALTAPLNSEFFQAISGRKSVTALSVRCQKHLVKSGKKPTSTCALRVY